jgi:hypothetical protein
MPVARTVERGDSTPVGANRSPRLRIVRATDIDEVPTSTRRVDHQVPAESWQSDPSRPPFVIGLSSPVSADDPLAPIDDQEPAFPVLPPERPDRPDEASPGVDDFGGLGAESPEAEPNSLRGDMRRLPSMFWEDTKSIFTWQNTLVLGVAGGASVAIRDNLNAPVRDYTAEHPQRWGAADDVFRQFGEAQYQVPVLAGVYGLSLWTGNDHCHEFSKAVLSAYGLNAAATMTLKVICNTQRPTADVQSGHYGFPSFHTSSTFTIASVLDEYYGWQVGLPAYTLAGLVGWSRIDQREHDLADVLFGAVLGVVIGKSVAGAHIERALNMQISPYYDPQNNATGVSFEKRY